MSVGILRWAFRFLGVWPLRWLKSSSVTVALVVDEIRRKALDVVELSDSVVETVLQPTEIKQRTHQWFLKFRYSTDPPQGSILTPRRAFKNAEMLTVRDEHRNPITKYQSASPGYTA